MRVKTVVLAPIPMARVEDDDEDENRIAAHAAQGVTEVFPDAVEEVAGGFLAGAHGLGLRHARVPFDSVLEGIVFVEFGDGFRGRRRLPGAPPETSSR